MKFLEKYSSYTKSKDYKLMELHAKILKRLKIESSVLGVKSIPIVGIYKLLKVLIKKEVSDEELVLIVIYILTDKLNVDVELTNSLKIVLTNDIPNFKSLDLKLRSALNTIQTIINIFFKKDNIVVGSLGKMFDVKIINKVLNQIGEFSISNGLNLDKFISIIDDETEKVLESLIKYLQN
jgi:hypothetical protein